MTDLKKYFFTCIYAFLVVTLQISTFSFFTDLSPNFILVNIAVSSALFDLGLNLVFISFIVLMIRAGTYDSQFLWYLPLIAVIFKFIYIKELKDPLLLCIFYTTVLTVGVTLFNTDTLPFFELLYKSLPINVLLAVIVYFIMKKLILRKSSYAVKLR
ncbi:MAG: hypothetical protein HRT47_12690 [Candidatus Caenarcaniphilales bacterium]|nr:hypothetical protein [Candidatus Caenarcaniphilales bacterium]